MATAALRPVGTPPSSESNTVVEDKWFRPVAMLAAILAPTYNALFAALNARGLPTSRLAAIGAESLILALCIAGCALSGGRNRDAGPLLLMFVAVVVGVAMSMANDTIYPDFIRNVAIICCFTALGLRVRTEQLILIFRIVSSLILGFLLVEMISLELYVWLFQPAKYLEASRGIRQFELNDTGLFANALGFRDRFSFGVFSGPRTSSLFLEQVSLPGYATVSLIFLSSKWENLCISDRILQIGLILLIVLSNNSRTSAGLLFVIAAGYFLFPLVTSRLTFLLPVLCLGAAFLIVGPTDKAFGSDDLVGRLSVTVANLSLLDVKDYLLGSVAVAAHSYDSGYVYVLVSGSMLGALALWVYVTLVPGAETAAQRRAHWSLAFYVYVWLLIGGTAIFTMKTAGLLWLLIGHMAAFPKSRPAPARHLVGNHH